MYSTTNKFALGRINKKRSDTDEKSNNELIKYKKRKLMRTMYMCSCPLCASTPHTLTVGSNQEKKQKTREKINPKNQRK